MKLIVWLELEILYQSCQKSSSNNPAAFKSLQKTQILKFSFEKTFSKEISRSSLINIKNLKMSLQNTGAEKLNDQLMATIYFLDD